MGIDVNPLACLITAAKAAQADRDVIRDLLADLPVAQTRIQATTIDFKSERKVDWFSSSVIGELSQIISWINKAKLREPELLVVAAALSAATRDASYCRKIGWKLHRMGEEERNSFNGSAWNSLERRLQYYVSAINSAPSVEKVEVIQADTKSALKHSLHTALRRPFDVVLTSPPYGDSKTTVQYGAASGLCLDVVSQLDQLSSFFVSGSEIDSTCLGGGRTKAESMLDLENVKRYWAGSGSSSAGRSVLNFLRDFKHVCDGISSVLKPGGTAIMVVGRRSTGGFRLKLDEFAVGCFEAVGFQLAKRSKRVFQEKRSPRKINRFGRCHSEQLRSRGTIKTMADEIILSFQKPAAPEENMCAAE